MARKRTTDKKELYKYLNGIISPLNATGIPLNSKITNININTRYNKYDTPLHLALRNKVNPTIILQILDLTETDVNLPIYKGHYDMYNREIENVPFLQAISYTTNDIQQPIIALAVINHPSFDILNDDFFAIVKKNIYDADNTKVIIQNLEKTDKKIRTQLNQQTRTGENYITALVRNIITILQLSVLLWCHLARQEVSIDLNTDINGRSIITFGLEYGLSSFVKFILQNKHLVLNAKNWDVCDCLYQKRYIATKILSKTQHFSHSPPALDTLCPLIFAAYNNEEDIVDLILNHKSFNSNTKCYVETPGSHGVSSGDPLLIAIMKFSKSKTKSECLVKVFKRVAELPSLNINQIDNDGKTALMYTVMYNDRDNSITLLQNPKIDINIKDKEGNRCLTISAQIKCNREPNFLMLELLERADLVQEDTTGKSALIQAWNNNNYDYVDILIDHPKINLNDTFQAYEGTMSPTDCFVNTVCRQRHKYVISPYQCQEKTPNASVTTLTNLIQNKNYSKTIIPTKAANGQTLLHFLIMGNHFGVFVNFLESRKDTNLQMHLDILDASDVDIWEALFLCYNSTVQALQSMCHYCEENPSAQNRPIHRTRTVAQKTCKIELFRIKTEIVQLIERILRLSSIDVNKVFDKPYYGTLLHRAISHRTPEIVDVILKSDRIDPSIPAASVVISNNEPHAVTPVGLIMKLYKPQVNANIPKAKEKPFYFLEPDQENHSIEAILLAMVTSDPRLMEDINPIRTQDRLAVLHVLIKESKFKALVELLNNQIHSKFKAIDPFIEDSKGISIWEAMCISHQLHSQYAPDSKEQEDHIHYLIESMEQAMEMLAIQDNTDINQKNQQGKTMFHFICMNGVNSLVSMFLKMDHVDINIQDNDGYTPFMYGVRELRVDIIEEYMNHTKCKIHTQNRYKQTIQTISDSMDPADLDPRVRSLITAAFITAKETETSTTQLLSELGVPEQLLYLKKSIDKDSVLGIDEKKRILTQIEGIESDYAVARGQNTMSEHSMSDLHARKLLRKRVYLCEEIVPKELFDYFIADGVLSPDNVEEITLKGTRKGMCQMLLSMLPRCGNKAYSSLIRALTESGQPHVAQELENYNPDDPQQPTQDAAGQVLQVFGQTGVAMAGQGVLMPVQVTSEGFLALPFYRLNTNLQ